MASEVSLKRGGNAASAVSKKKSGTIFLEIELEQMFITLPLVGATFIFGLILLTPDIVAGEGK